MERKLAEQKDKAATRKEEQEREMEKEGEMKGGREKAEGEKDWEGAWAEDEDERAGGSRRTRSLTLTRFSGWRTWR